MSRRLCVMLLSACAGGADSGPGTAPGTDGTDAADGTDGTDAADGTDGADGTGGASPDTADTGAPPCTEGLQVTLDGAPVASGGLVSLGEAPAWSDARAVSLTLTNPCAAPLRFLGHPGDWVSGDGFALEALPPIYLEPGESAPLALAFAPADEGPAAGALRLPYDQPGSPLELSLAATAGPPLPVVFVGEGRRVTTTLDYGATFALDTWETLEAHTDALQRGGCASAEGFVAVGGSAAAFWWTSPDGLAWTAHSDPAGSWMADCAAIDGGFVAAAGAPWASADGQTWAAGAGGFTGNHLRVVAASGGVVVAAGDGGRVATTTDGAAWETDGAPLSGAIQALAARDGVFVAGGAAGLLATSTDGGRSWSEQWVGGSAWTAVVATQSGFVAGGGGTLIRSADGATWTTVGATAVTPLAAVGDLLFGADGGALYRSDDGGLTWTELRPDDGGPGYTDALVGG